MHFKTIGFIISSKELGEKGALIKCITTDRGLLQSFVLRSNLKKNHSTITIGHLILINYYSKEGSLGRIVPELLKSYTNSILSNRTSLFMLISICDILCLLLDNHNDNTNKILQNIRTFCDNSLKCHNSNKKIADFIILTKTILSLTGYGINLSSCVATRNKDIASLTFISPKSWQAVSTEAGQPFADKMLPLPQFLITNNTEKVSNICLLQSIRILDKFLDHITFSYLHKITPKSWHKNKEHLINILQEKV